MANELSSKDIMALTLLASVRDMDTLTRRRLRRSLGPYARQMANGLTRRAASARVRKSVALLKRGAAKRLPQHPIWDRVYAD